MVQVTELGYVGCSVKDMEAWKDFATHIMGFEIADNSTEETCFLRMDYWHHRIILNAGGKDDLDFMGLRVAGPEEFKEMQRQLSDAGIDFRVCSGPEARERHVLELLKTKDPAGYNIEIFHGPEVEYHKPFYPGRRMHGRFKTGNSGLGHCVIGEPDVTAAYEFYRTLGMRGNVEYPSETGEFVDAPTFMHCCERDHSIAFGMGSKKQLYHMMVEFEDFNDLGLTYELVRRNDVPIHFHPGKHANDMDLSFYMYTPSGWLMECGWGGNKPRHQSEYHPEDLFGHYPARKP